MDFDKIQDELIKVYQDRDYSSSNKMVIKLRLRTPSRAPLRLAGYLHNISKVVGGDGVKYLKDLGLEGISEIIDEYQNLATAMEVDQFPGIEMSEDEKEVWKKNPDLKFGLSSVYMVGTFKCRDEDLELPEKMMVWINSFISPKIMIPSLIKEYKQDIEETLRTEE